VGAPIIERTLAPLSEPVASFGAAVCGDWLYVYSGHIGATHEHSRDNVSSAFRRLDLRDGKTWESLAAGPGLQSPALIAHGELLYRIGGLSAHNAPDEPADLRTVSECACYEPTTNHWRELPSLPEPRSSHDAVVCGDLIYVAGGWNLQSGTDDAPWHDTVLSLDITNLAAGWQTVAKQPFQRRALTVAELQGRIWVIGGLCPDGSFSRSVDIFDPSTHSWSKGSELPGSEQNGFAASAFRVAGHLYLSGRDGQVLRVAENSDQWKQYASLATPRFFHRLVPYAASELLIVGGAGDSGHLRSIEAVSLVETQTASRVRIDTIALPRGMQAVRPVLCAKGRVYAAACLSTPKAALPSTRAGAPADWSHLMCLDMGNQSTAWVQVLPRRLTNMAAMARESGGRQQLLVVGELQAAEASPKDQLSSWFFDIDRVRWREIRGAMPPVHLGATTLSDQSLSLFLKFRFAGNEPPAQGAARLFRYDQDGLATEVNGAEPACDPLPLSAVEVDNDFYLAQMQSDATQMRYAVFNTATLRYESLPSPPQPVDRPQLVVVGKRIYLVGEVEESNARWTGIFSLSDHRTDWQLVVRNVPTMSGERYVLSTATGLFLIEHDKRQEVLHVVFVDLAR
jgi:N-acetylneuraminic acid mutarotase